MKAQAMLPEQTDPLVSLGRWLQKSGYRFTTPTPATHQRVNARPGNEITDDLRGIFGWSRPFERQALAGEAISWLDETDMLTHEGRLLRSRVRFSTLGQGLYVHSAFPTSGAKAVFFGPDTYRFVALIEAELRRSPLPASARILDVGCGAGPGGIAAALATGPLSVQTVLADINPLALRHARANAALAGLAGITFAQGDLFKPVEGLFDLIVANPPYLVDVSERAYRHGGGPLGAGLSERIVAEGAPRLAPGGRLVLYTGAAIINGHDPLHEALQSVLHESGWPSRYRELDPDVFGEELDAPAYRHADRIAAVALTVERPAA